MENFDREAFSYWLRVQRRVEKPMSQEALAEAVGTTQPRISRWEAEDPNTDPPTLDECLRLSEIFDADFVDLATLVGRWSDELARKVLISYNHPNWRGELTSKKEGGVRPVAISRVIATANAYGAAA